MGAPTFTREGGAGTLNRTLRSPRYAVVGYGDPLLPHGPNVPFDQGLDLTRVDAPPPTRAFHHLHYLPTPRDLLAVCSWDAIVGLFGRSSLDRAQNLLVLCV